MSYVYIKSEPGLWTVGHYDGGEWEPQSDHSKESEAAARVAELNGGGRPESRDPAHVVRLVKTLDEIAVALNDWYAERQAAHEERAKALRERQERSWRVEPEPWVFAEEMIRRDDAETLEPIRRLMNMADEALKPFGV